jgi:hypothetical protein
LWPGWCRRNSVIPVNPQALTQQQIAEICGVHAPIMQRFGYLLPDCGRSVAVEDVRPMAPAK